MKKSGIWLALTLLASSIALQAQVSVEVRLEQGQFVSKEAMNVAVRIVNHSGQSLHFGKHADWLTFNVESYDGFVVSQTEKPPVIGEFDLESGKVATKRVDLAPYFELGRIGFYTVTATIRIKEWSSEISSEPAKFQIVNGTKLWEGAFGVPRQATTNQGPPEVRKYILQQATYTKTMKLYLRLTDSRESQVFKVTPIGPMVSFSRPEPQVDHDSNLHVVYQSGARRYLYAVISPEGDLIRRETYDVNGTRPHLHVDSAGKITVIDGARRVTEDDIPKPPEQVLSNEVIAPK